MHPSAKIAKALEKATGRKGKRFKVKMRGTKEVGAFIRKIEQAHKNAGKSTARYGDSPQLSTKDGE